jgi:benzoyl-CoA reductase/2-hydroxyglutaryl-CoA dehydratase subunit BcrC/BadD/HgdB
VTSEPRHITLEQWDRRYAELRAAGLREPAYGGPLRRHLDDGDRRLEQLRYDDSPASLRLWNFLLTEEDRLRDARAAGEKLVGTMKDLGTVPVMAYALDGLRAFYPDGAWWIPCVMNLSAGLLRIADSLGVDEAFCPVRAMLGAFVTGAHFPRPDLLICSVGAVCDDFSAIAQRLNGLGYPILWWEIVHRRPPAPGEPAVTLPGGVKAPTSQVAFVRGELQRVRAALETLAGQSLDDARLAAGIARANQVRRRLRTLRELAFTADAGPLPALELLLAEMLAIHFCSDQPEATAVLDELIAEAERRVASGSGVLPADAARVFCVNPVADLRVMNLLERCGGRVCGTEYLFAHALDPIPDDVEPIEALARAALADPMVGSAADRAERICHDARRFRSDAILISRIPGASHCALEGGIIADVVRARLGLPVAEIEVPPIADAIEPTLRTRIEALIETAIRRRTS